VDKSGIIPTVLFQKTIFPLLFRFSAVDNFFPSGDEFSTFSKFLKYRIAIFKREAHLNFDAVYIIVSKQGFAGKWRTYAISGQSENG
jgi:hypothetical protein